MIKDSVWQSFQIAVHERLEAQDARLQVHHTTTANSGWGGNSKVLDFEHHRHCL